MRKKIVICFIVLIIFIVFLILFKDKILKIFYPKKYEEIVSLYAEEYNVDENLIYAVIKAESDFDENAVSNKNALGLMQIMEDTAKDIAKKNNINVDENNARKDILDINNNINIGTKYLATLLEKYQNTNLALAAYNAGTGNVDNWIENKILNEDGSNIENVPYKETNNYIRIILQNYKIYSEIYVNRVGAF
jgi:soluble lytic murein transglycosylase